MDKTSSTAPTIAPGSYSKVAAARKFDILNPLTPAHLDDINAALADYEIIRTAIQKAAYAGIQMPDTLKKIEADEARLRQIKQVYFPGR